MPGSFVICGEGRIVICRSPAEILEFVLDVDRYRQADLKIGRVHYVKREGNVGEVRHDGRLMGIKAPPVTLGYTLTPYSRLEFRGLKVPWPLRGFEGFFTCAETPQGTVVLHRECFIFGWFLGRLFSVLLGWWVRRDTPAEVLHETPAGTHFIRASVLRPPLAGGFVAAGPPSGRHGDAHQLDLGGRLE